MFVAGARNSKHIGKPQRAVPDREDWNDWAARSAKSKPVSPQPVVMAIGADTLSLLRTQ